MRSRVADEVRQATDRDIMEMSIDERIELAFRLGDEAVRTLAAARGISLEEAHRILEREKRRGRRYSQCIEALDDASE